MAVSKRTRYEVLKRDNHACGYCGGAAPDVALTVDHVTPVALGGSDDPSNLVAACRDCNAGKSSTSPDAALVADVRADALRHAEVVRQAYAALVAQMGDRDDYVAEFENAYYYEPLPEDWRDSIARWFEMGVPIDILVDAAQVACRKQQTFRGHGRFTYMCGIIWNKVRQVGDAAYAKRDLDGCFMSDDELTEVRIAAYEYGYRQALRNLNRDDPLSSVVDHLPIPPDPWEVPA